MVTYYHRGRGVQGPGRSEPPQAARRALQARRADARGTRAAPADDALRGNEAFARARGGQARRNAAARARKAALPEPRPDPAGPRPVGEQVRRAVGGDPERPEAQP